MELGIGADADVGFAWSRRRRCCRRRSSAASYGVIGNDRQILQHRQWARYDEAASHYAKAVQVKPQFSSLYFLQAAALALAGRVEEARPIVRQLLELEPGFRSSAIFKRRRYSALADKFKEGARILGLPE